MSYVPTFPVIMCLFVFSELDMRVSSDVWATLHRRLEELLALLSSDSAGSESSQTLSALQGVALVLHLAALCSLPIRYLPSNKTESNFADPFVRSQSIKKQNFLCQQFLSSRLGVYRDYGPGAEGLSVTVRRSI